MLKGADGLTPYVGENNNWWIGDVDTGILALGTDGYTPVKGVDYFTTEEVQQIQNEVSEGAIGDFKAVVDTETNKFNTNATEKLNAYNSNADGKFTTYNANAEAKFSEYTSNADTKLSEYNQNDSDKTALYNANAESKLSAYDSNAQTKLDLYNQNDSEKTEAYNSNAQTKLANYNTNADNRVAEFDSHTEQIRTDISGLKSDVSANQSELAKTNLSLDALWKMNRGQTYDVLEQESEAYSVDVPSGAKYAGVDKVGGKSVVWNQLVQDGNFTEASSWTTSNATMTVSNNIGTVIQNNINGYINKVVNSVRGHKCLAMLDIKGVEGKTYTFNGVLANLVADGTWQRRMEIFTASGGKTYLVVGQKSEDEFPVEWQIRNACIFDLTQMFGAGNEPNTVEEFEAMFPADYYPYSEPTIISSQTDRVEVVSADGTISQQITTGFPVLNSAGSVYDYIDLNESKLHQRVGVVDLGSLDYYVVDSRFNTKIPITGTGIRGLNIITQKYVTSGLAISRELDKSICANLDSYLFIYDTSYTDVTTFKQSLSGQIAYYELAEEVITDITIPTELSDWLTVEAGGSITFHNADDGKRLLIPSKLSFVRKLDEVTV